MAGVRSRKNTDTQQAQVSTSMGAAVEAVRTGPTRLWPVVAPGMGFIFGWAFEKSRVFEPETIRNQFLFSDFRMLKMFLGAVTAGTLVLSALSVFAPRYYDSARAGFTGSKKRSVPRGIVLGGALLGMGMAIGGACPGMVVAQMGSFTENSTYTLAGLLAGVWLYAAIEPWLRSGPFRLYDHTYDATKFLDHITGVPRLPLTLGFGALLGGVIYALELYEPSAQEMASYNTAPVASIWEMVAWPSWLSGLILGSLQLPGLLFIDETLGSASAYVCACAQALPVLPSSLKFPQFVSAKDAVGTQWQVLYLGGAFVGAFVSASLSGSVGRAHGIAPLQAFTGGFIMMMGSRLAAGCTSGHGLSGMSMLHPVSFIAVAAMFGAGIVTAVSWTLTGTPF